MKLLWDTNEPRDHVMEAQNPGIIPGDKENKVCAIIDVAIPGNISFSKKETEELEKYQDLRQEIEKIWKMKEVKGVPIVIWAFSSVSKSLGK